MSRFLPGRPGLMLILGIAALVVLGVGFVDQALTGRAMLAEYAQAREKVERLAEQNRLLQQSLDRAQQGQLVPERAWVYFGRLPKGAGVIVAGAPSAGASEADAPAAAAENPAAAPTAAPPVPAPEPAWWAFVKRLVQP